MLTANPSLKNSMLPGSTAASDLGLGDQLQQQVADRLDEMRKKRQSAVNVIGGNANQASASLSPSVMSLFGGAGGTAGV